MVQSVTSPHGGPTALAKAGDSTPSEVAGLLGEVERLLGEGRPAAALERIGRSSTSSPWLANAAAVCQLRLGNARPAVDSFRELVLTGGLFLRDDVPTVFKVNFAIALIADGNLTGGLRALDELRQEGQPAVREVQDAVRRWEEGLTFWEKVRWYAGGRPPRPLALDFTLGWLHKA